ILGSRTRWRHALEMREVYGCPNTSDILRRTLPCRKVTAGGFISPGSDVKVARRELPGGVDEVLREDREDRWNLDSLDRFRPALDVGCEGGADGAADPVGGNPRQQLVPREHGLRS